MGNNTRYRDKGFVILKLPEIQIAYYCPEEVYDQYAKYTDGYFKRIILQEPKAFIHDELTDKRYYLGIKDEEKAGTRIPFKSPIPVNTLLTRRKSYKKCMSMIALKDKTKRVLNPNAKLIFNIYCSMEKRKLEFLKKYPDKFKEEIISIYEDYFMPLYRKNKEEFEYNLKHNLSNRALMVRFKKLRDVTSNKYTRLRVRMDKYVIRETLKQQMKNLRK